MMNGMKIVGGGREESNVIQERKFREWEKTGRFRDFDLLPKNWESMKRNEKLELFGRLLNILLEVDNKVMMMKKKLVALHHVYNLCLLKQTREVFVKDLKIIRKIRTICKRVLEQQHVKSLSIDLKPFSMMLINFITMFFCPNSVEEETFIIFRKTKSITEFLSHFLFPSKRNGFSLLETVRTWTCMFYSNLARDYYELHQIFLKYYNPMKQNKKTVATRIFKYFLKLVDLYKKKDIIFNHNSSNESISLNPSLFVFVSNVSFIYRNFSYWFDTLPSLREQYYRALPVELLLKIQKNALELTPMKCVNQRRWILDSISGPCYAFGEICANRCNIDLLVLKGVRDEVFGGVTTTTTTVKFDENNPQNGTLCEYLKIYAFLLTGLEESVIVKVFDRTKKLITHYLYPLLYSIPYDRMLKESVSGTYENYNFILLNFIERALIGLFNSPRVCTSINSIGKKKNSALSSSSSLLERFFQRNVFLVTKICECSQKRRAAKEFPVTIQEANVTSFYRHSFAACLMTAPYLEENRAKSIIRGYRTMNTLWDNFYDFECNAQGNMLAFFCLFDGQCFLEEVAFGPFDISTLNRWMDGRKRDGDQLNSGAALRLLAFMCGLQGEVVKKNKENNGRMTLVEDVGSGNTCEYCSKKVKRKNRCGRCRTVFYCDRVCQTKHWKVHKKECEKL